MAPKILHCYPCLLPSIIDWVIFEFLEIILLKLNDVFLSYCKSRWTHRHVRIELFFTPQWQRLHFQYVGLKISRIKVQAQRLIEHIYEHEFIEQCRTTWTGELENLHQIRAYFRQLNSSKIYKIPKNSLTNFDEFYEFNWQK